MTCSRPGRSQGRGWARRGGPHAGDHRPLVLANPASWKQGTYFSFSQRWPPKPVSFQKLEDPYVVLSLQTLQGSQTTMHLHPRSGISHQLQASAKRPPQLFIMWTKGCVQTSVCKRGPCILGDTAGSSPTPSPPAESHLAPQGHTLYSLILATHDTGTRKALFLLPGSYGRLVTGTLPSVHPGSSVPEQYTHSHGNHGRWHSLLLRGLS